MEIVRFCGYFLPAKLAKNIHKKKKNTMLPQAKTLSSESPARL